MTTEAGKRLLDVLDNYAHAHPTARGMVHRKDVAAIEAEAVAAERERIRLAVEGLPNDPYDDAEWRGADKMRAAVLAIVRGER